MCSIPRILYICRESIIVSDFKFQNMPPLDPFISISSPSHRYLSSGLLPSLLFFLEYMNLSSCCVFYLESPTLRCAQAIFSHLSGFDLAVTNSQWPWLATLPKQILLPRTYESMIYVFFLLLVKCIVISLFICFL